MLKELVFPTVSSETPLVESKPLEQLVIQQWVVLRGLESPNASEKVLIDGSPLSPAMKAVSVTKEVRKVGNAYTDLIHLI